MNPINELVLLDLLKKILSYRLDGWKCGFCHSLNTFLIDSGFLADFSNLHYINIKNIYSKVHSLPPRTCTLLDDELTLSLHNERLSNWSWSWAELEAPVPPAVDPEKCPAPWPEKTIIKSKSNPSNQIFSWFSRYSWWTS